MDEDPFRRHHGRLQDEDDDEPQELASSRPDRHLDRYLFQARTLMVTGPISDELGRSCSTRLLVMEQMDPERPITMMINSPGGSADAGFALYDVLRFVRCPIRSIVNGLCASAAVIVHLAAPKGQRFAMPQSRFLLHQPSTTGFGTASDLDITAREVIKLRERYNRIISEATGRDLERILDDVRRDFWLNSEEAAEYGLVDKMIRTRDELD